MSKPEDISQEGWDAASEILYSVDAMPSDGNISVIARALVAATLAEREACAEDANGVDPEILEGMSRGAESLYCRSRVDAAAAIRKRSDVNAVYTQKVLED